MTFTPPFSPDSWQPTDRSHLLKIAIVGRGFSGMMTAIGLLKGFDRPFHLVMFDPNPKIDGGEGTGRSAGLLNSRVKDLSIDPDVANDFQEWLEADGRWNIRAITDGVGIEHSFQPGEIFSDYVYHRFAEALRARTDVVMQVRLEAVVAIGRHPEQGFALLSADRQSARFDAVFLATGYGLRCAEKESRSTGSTGEVLVIGGGIHAVDRALSLLKDGAASHVTLISASGFLPQSHTRAAVGPVTSSQPLPGTLRGAFRFLREAAKIAEAEGSGWQGIMNGFRARARELWQVLTPAERSRFKRHVKAIYDSHRNRLPPEHYSRLNAAMSQGTISVKKGKVERIAINGVLLSTTAGLEVLPADRAIDCRSRAADINNPLFRSLFGAGLIKRDEVDLGILVDRHGRAESTLDLFQGLFAMGPLGLGSLPDIDLLPEIVVQSYGAAAALNVWTSDAANRQNAVDVA